MQPSNFIRHEPCPKCGSSDAMSRYDDGHGYCFSCNHYEHGTGTAMPRKERMQIEGFIDGEVTGLSKRQITEDTCKKWDYRVGHYFGRPVQVANYKDNEGSVVAQKIRFANKDFKIIGDSSSMGLFGMHLWKGSYKMVVVTEGELDALSVSQLQQHKWPVVSVPNGAQSAAKSVAKSLEWLEQFETVVFMFDNDEPGIKAAGECASLMSPRKAKIASLPLKDANDMLVANRGGEVIEAMWRAKEYRPDGIVGGTDLWDYITKVDSSEAISYPFDGLTKMTHGMRKGELVTITAGSGIGKSQICREICHWMLTNGQAVGYIALEESVRRTALGILGIEMSVPLHLKLKEVPEEEVKKAYDSCLSTGKFFTYDHFGSLDSDNLINRIRYMVKGCGCGWIILDHLSIVVSGMGEGDERRLIDNTMTRLRSIVEELKIGLVLVSHLKRPEGRGHEEGAATSLSQLRGSAGIAQLSDIVLGLERNQQDESQKNITLVRVLKNRYTGECGLACRLEYNQVTGRLKDSGQPPVEIPEELQ